MLCCINEDTHTHTYIHLNVSKFVIQRHLQAVVENTGYTQLIWLLDISTLSTKGQKGPLTHLPLPYLPQQDSCVLVIPYFLV